jgi:hypothetical protein
MDSGALKIELFTGNKLQSFHKNFLEDTARCYQIVFNHFWQEQWTLESARDEIKRSLREINNRRPIISLLTRNGEVKGFAWIIMTDLDGLGEDDMPFDLSESKKKQGLEATKYWLRKAGHNRVVIFREIGILKDYFFSEKKHNASRLSLPIIKTAYEEGYRALIYWSDPDNSSFQQGIGFGWHPIHYFPEENRAILKGGLIDLTICLEGILNRDKQILKLMKENKKKYYCQ